MKSSLPDKSVTWNMSRFSKSAGVILDINNYREVKKIGEGGFWEVFLYEEEATKNNVAIKVLKYLSSEGYDDIAEKQFKREVNILMKLHIHVFCPFVEFFLSGVKVIV